MRNVRIKREERNKRKDLKRILWSLEDRLRRRERICRKGPVRKRLRGKQLKQLRAHTEQEEEMKTMHLMMTQSSPEEEAPSKKARTDRGAAEIPPNIAVQLHPVKAVGHVADPEHNAQVFQVVLPRAGTSMQRRFSGPI